MDISTEYQHSLLLISVVVVVSRELTLTRRSCLILGSCLEFAACLAARSRSLYAEVSRTARPFTLLDNSFRKSQLMCRSHPLPAFIYPDTQ